MMTSGGVADDLSWWRAHRDAPQKDAAAMRDVLARLQAWKAQHDQDRALQPPPFLRMAWDGVFADEHHQVAEAILQMEDLLQEALR